MNKTALVAAIALGFGGLALTGCPDREPRPAEQPAAPPTPPPAAETAPPPGEPMPARDQMDQMDQMDQPADPATRPAPTPDAPAGEGVGPDGA